MQTSDLIRALEDADAYPDPPPDRIEVLQTHISVLFFTHNRVYKVKKPFKLDFLDYSTLEQRRHFCEEEVRLNRRLARDIYLGVVPITCDHDGKISVSGSGETIEYAVEMVRLPAERMMSTLLERGEIDDALLNEIAHVMSQFHEQAATGPGVDEYAEPTEILEQAEDNLRGIEPYVGASTDANAAISGTLFARLRTTAREWLADNEDVLNERVRSSRIREGHGDLHAGNICLTRAGVVIYDCIEFSRRFRCRDVACELAFLAMDLDLRGFRGFARYLLHRYAELNDDEALPVVAEFYKLHLALVRGKVACIRAADCDVVAAEREHSRFEAMRYFQLAGAYTIPPAMILMCGLPATGKSHAARALAKPFEAGVIRSDVVRKELAGVSAKARGGGEFAAGIYTPQFTEQTYAEVLNRAMDHIEQRRTVVIDATFSSAKRRQPFVEAANESDVPYVIVELTCDEATIRERMRSRARDLEEVSDADWTVYQQAKERFEPPSEIPEPNRIRVDSQRPSEELVAEVIDRLVMLAGNQSVRRR